MRDLSCNRADIFGVDCRILEIAVVRRGLGEIQVQVQVGARVTEAKPIARLASVDRALLPHLAAYTVLSTTVISDRHRLTQGSEASINSEAIAMSEKWHRLHLANRGDIPPLLYKYSPAFTGYELYMTDLNSMWSEHLDREAILKRADEDNTPIDPSEDLDQFKVLLTKIQEGLQSGPGSKVSLQPRTRGRDHTLELRVISKLPAPLEPLVWKVFLSKKAQSSMTRHLLLPLINAEAEQEARQRSLIQELNKKDWVLSKLFDKFETLGIDLTAIFPGASGIRAGRKGLTLTEMGRYIKGLAPFDEESWREEISKSSSGSVFSTNIVAELSEGSPNSTQLGLLKLPPDGWWEGLIVSNNATSSTPSNDDKKPETNPAADSLETNTDSGTETGADEFEVRINAY